MFTSIGFPSASNTYEGTLYPLLLKICLDVNMVLGDLQVSISRNRKKKELKKVIITFVLGLRIKGDVMKRDQYSLIYYSTIYLLVWACSCFQTIMDSGRGWSSAYLRETYLCRTKLNCRICIINNLGKWNSLRFRKTDEVSPSPDLLVCIYDRLNMQDLRWSLPPERCIHIILINIRIRML